MTEYDKELQTGTPEYEAARGRAGWIRGLRERCAREGSRIEAGSRNFIRSHPGIAGGMALIGGIALGFLSRRLRS